ncbi:MAG: YraN family protein [Undibacterium curvum]|uniref:UPF0102 protein H8K43_10435 n=1 Tax=Undibacterium curvum TaxID=2762294 RepID=A0ABR7A5L3_9BURK|nr:YraN family protein [Undibacterium curvum]MBC3932091.1 YraN family protein [Undibacterium curvum]
MKRETRPQTAAPDRRTPQRRRGDAGEAQALAHLEQAGLRLVQKNFLCPGGEIDLIMQDRETLVFVEVRSRASASFGGALASITPAKQRKWQHAAQVYLMGLRSQPACRFDVIAIEAGKITWLQNVVL